MKKKEQSGAGLATQLRESAPGAFGLTGAAALGGSEAECAKMCPFSTRPSGSLYG